MFESLARTFRERLLKRPGYLPGFSYLEAYVGELIMMPSRNSSADGEWDQQEHTPECVQVDSPAAAQKESLVDLSVWKRAPKERTAPYFPTYSTVSKAIQTALRGWVREWFNANTEILLRPHTAYPILVYQCTHPFSGRPTNMFTYDIQQTEALHRAFASAAYRLGRELKTIDTKRFGWFTREHYFAYRSKEVVKYVSKNRRALYRMLNVETVLMDSILKFAIIDLPKIGLEEAAILLRRAFNTQLRRFSEEFDLSVRTEDLLRVATDALVSKLPNDNVIVLPVRTEEAEPLPLAA